MRILRSLATTVLVATALPTVASAQLSLEKLQIHGFLTQGFADADGLSLNGISKRATADYRVAALQFRYDVTNSDGITLQFRSRRLGTNPIRNLEPAVALNWAYYERKFNSVGVTAKAGLIPAPRGIYNEIRSVGTLLPFYRAPINLYPEGFEAIDGVSVAKTFDFKKAGSFDLVGYYGGFDNAAATFPATGPKFTTAISRFENAYGGQAWYNTPIRGVRFGVGGVKFKSRGADTIPVTAPIRPFTRWYGSLDATFDNAFFRSEYTLLSAGANTAAYYFQGGVRVFDRLWINGQNELSDRTLAGRTFRLQRDASVGLNYVLSSGVSLKIEQHSAKGYVFERYLNTLQAPGKSNYTIASVSASF